MAALGAGYVIHPAGDLTRAKQSRAGNRLWLFKLPISCYSSQRMLRQLLGIVDAMCCTSVSRQPGSVLLQCCYQLRARNSGQRPPGGVSSRIGRLARGASIQPRLGLAHHESCGSSRQRNRYISDLSCLSASHVCTLEPGPIPRSPVFFSENLILLLPLRWLAGSGQGVGGSYFYFGGEKSRAVALEG